MQHLKKHHHTDEGIRNLLNKKYCGIRECNELIGMDQVACKQHQHRDLNRQLVSEFDPDAGAIQSNLVQQDIFNNGDTPDPVQFFKQKNGKLFQMKDLLIYTTINRGAPSQQKKSRVAAALTGALSDLNTVVSDESQRIHIINRGLIKWKLIAGTYFFKLWRPTAPGMASELELRHKLYVNGQYIQLLNRIKQGQKEFNKMEMKNYQFKCRLIRNGMNNHQDHEEKNIIENDDDRLKKERDMIKMEKQAKKRLNNNVTYDKLKRSKRNWNIMKWKQHWT